MTKTGEFPRICILLSAHGEQQDGLRRIPVVMVFRGYKGKLKFSIAPKDVLQAVANFRKRGNGEMPIDYEHSLEMFNGPEWRGEPLPAAGWLRKMEDAPDEKGVLWGWAQLTQQAAKMVDDGEYKYISPVVDWGARDRLTGELQGTTITSLALTNKPLLDRMPAIPVSEQSPRLAAMAFSEAGWKFDHGDVVEERKKKTVKVILSDHVAGTVRLVDDDNSESVHKVEGLRILTMSDVPRGKDGIVDFGALPAEDGVLIASEVLRAMTVQGELTKALEKGIITPAQLPDFQRIAMSDLETFRRLVASMKPQVDFSVHGFGGTGDETPELARIDATLECAARDKMKANSQLLHAEAIKLACAENRQLVERRSSLQFGGKQ